MRFLFHFILIFLILACFPLAASQVNLLVDYHVLGFTTLKQLTFSASSNVRFYLEYNPLIPLTLAWNKVNLLEQLKEPSSALIQFFNFQESPDSDSQRSNWSHEMRMQLGQEVFSGLELKDRITTLEKSGAPEKIQSLDELNHMLQVQQKGTWPSGLCLKVDPGLFHTVSRNEFFQLLARYKEHPFHLYLYADKDLGVSENDRNAFLDLTFSLKTKKDLSEAETKIFRLTTSLFSMNLFDRVNDLELDLFSLTFPLPKKFYISSKEYPVNDEKYVTVFDKDSFITFDTRTGYLKKWFVYSQGECLIHEDSFKEQLYVREKDQVISLARSNLVYSRFDNGLSFRSEYTPGIQVEKNVILQYGRLVLSYKIQNEDGKRKILILQLANMYSPSLYHALVSASDRYGFYYIYGKKVSKEWEPEYNNFVNMNTRYGIGWEFYNAITGFEFLRGFYGFSARTSYKFTLLPYEQKVITQAFRQVKVPEKIRDKFMVKMNEVTNQYYGDYTVK